MAFLTVTATDTSVSLIPTVILIILMNVLTYGSIIYLFILLVKALRKYLKSGEVRKEKAAACKIQTTASRSCLTFFKMSFTKGTLYPFCFFYFFNSRD